MNKVILFVVLLYFPFVYAQSKEEKKRNAEIKELLYDAQKAIEEDNFSLAEANYRKIVALDDKNITAQYNLGTAYYNKGKNKEAGKQFVKAAEIAKDNPEASGEKHKIYHNLGNVLMNDKNYKGAVEAYKNALRNNPKDDETRYNLALAKLMLEEHGDSGGGGEDENQEENQDQQDQGDNQEEENKENEGEDNQDKGDEGENEEEQDSQQQNEEGKPEEQDSPENGEAQPQPTQGKLSQEQIQSLLEAMNNEEKKVQDKINAEQQKGVPVKSDKDW